MSWPPLAFLGSAAAMAIAALTRAPLPPIDSMRSFGFFDLQVYRQSAEVMLTGGRLYSATFRHGMGFTYPPFAALVLVVLRAASLRVDEIAVTLLNLGLVATIAHLALRLPGSGWSTGTAAGRASRVRRSRAAWLAAAAVIWVAPVTAAIGYGQIDLLVAVLVIADLVAGDARGRGGLAIGLAAGLKLTPLIFVVYLACTGRVRMAARALGAFALTIALSFDAVPSDARAFWTQDLFGTGHITGGRPGRGPGDQSLRGAVLRLVAGGGPTATLIWLILAGLVAVAGLWLAVRVSRRGEEAWGVTLVAVTGLLICPVTWVHHWVIALPGLIIVLSHLRRSRRDRWRALGAFGLGVGAVAFGLLIRAHPLGEHLSLGDQFLADLWVIVGLGTLAVAAARELRRRTPAGPRPPFAAPRPLRPRPPVGPRPPVASTPPAGSPSPAPSRAVRRGTVAVDAAGERWRHPEDWAR